MSDQLQLNILLTTYCTLAVLIAVPQVGGYLTPRSSYYPRIRGRVFVTLSVIGGACAPVAVTLAWFGFNQWAGGLMAVSLVALTTTFVGPLRVLSNVSLQAWHRQLARWGAARRAKRQLTSR